MSNKNVILITGWGMSISALQGLSDTLQQQGHCVWVYDIFDPEQIPETLIHKALKADVLIGWSLGGQLAIVLSAYLLKHYQHMKPVITLASNPCFVASKTWTHAMPKHKFNQFAQQYLAKPKATLKQFYFNVCQGDIAVKSQWQTLISDLPLQNDRLYQHGLNWLQQLNIIDIVEKIPSYHIFAQHDQLVPLALIHDLPKYFSYYIMPNVSHSFPVFYPQQTAEQIQYFLQKKITL